MSGTKEESQSNAPCMRIRVNGITLSETMNFINVKTEVGFLNLIGEGTFFVLRKNGCETNYGFGDNLCFVYEGIINELNENEPFKSLKPKHKKLTVKRLIPLNRPILFNYDIGNMQL